MGKCESMPRIFEDEIRLCTFQGLSGPNLHGLKEQDKGYCRHLSN